MEKNIYSSKFENQYTKIVGKSRGLGCTHATLQDALDVAVAGDSILITDNQIIDSTGILFDVDDIEIIFNPGIKIICNTPLTTLVQITADRVKTKNISLYVKNSVSNGIIFSGNLNYHEDISVTLDSVGSILTNAYLLDSGKKANYIRGYARQINGSITNGFIDNSGNLTNDANIRTMIG